MKILLFEDEKGIVEGLKGYWNDKGYKVLTTDNIEEARSLALNQQPDIIFLDQTIHGDSKAGTTLCSTLKGDGLTAIIVGIGQSATPAEWLAAGADFAAKNKLMTS